MINLLMNVLLLGTMSGFGQAPVSGSIQGRVLDADGKPLAGANVFVVREENMLKSIRGPVTDDLGNFTLTDVAPGVVYVNAFKESDGYPGYLYTIFAFYTVPGQRIPKVDVKTGEAIRDVVVQLGARAANLNLLITDEAGTPLPAGSLEASRPDLPNSGILRRGVRGKESLPVPPVPFRLTIKVEGYLPWHYGDGDWQGKAGLISLKSGESLTLTVCLRRKAR